MSLISDVVNIYDNYNFSTEIIVASIRNPIHVSQSAMIGADICTIPLKVISQLMKHALTDAGVDKF